MFKHLFSISTLISLFLMSFSLSAAQTEDVLVLNTTVSVPLSTKEGTGVTDLQLREVFERAGIGLHIEHVPAERAMLNANKGIDDGTFLRVSGLNKTYTNLVMVPESFMDFEFVAISKKENIHLEGWKNLQSYSLGFITGWKIVEDNTKNVETVIRVKNVDQLFRLLELNRTDLIIYERLRALVALGKNPIKGVKILEPPITRKPMFLYLNEKHKDLIPKIVNAIRSSKADGMHDRLQNLALQPYLGSP